MHYMMHGEHAQRFKGYLGALRKAEANLLEHLGVSERQLETGFQNYLRSSIQKSARQIVNVSGETWDMQVESIPDSEAQISIAEIFLANGKLTDARRHLEVLTATAPGSTRVSYYRGILARLAGDSAAREFFVDALLDPFLAPRAAVQLVAMGDSNIPAVRSILEEAASARTRTPEVYLALATIHQEEVRRIEESVRLNLARDGAAAPPAEGEKESIGRNNPAAPVVEWKSYMSGVADAGKVGYELLADSDRQPRVSLVLAPYYPAELLAEKASGEVVIDVQVGEDGKVGGIWVVSATPELFESLATSSVREWEFERIPAKIRVIVRFNP
jgi:TonB family protein